MTRYIAIDGKGGSGKTHLTNLLEEKLSVPVFHLDEYGNDYEPFIGIPKLVEKLQHTDAPVLIFEGVGVFKSDFDEFNAFKILVDITDEVRKIRVGGRDVPTDERSQEEWDKIFDIWIKAESEYFTDELKTKADLVVGEEYDVDEIINVLSLK